MLIGPLFPAASGGAAASDSKMGDAPTFKPYSNKDGLEISTGTMASSAIMLIKGECVVEASSRELFNFIVGGTSVEYNTMMHEADAMFIDGRLMTRYEGRGYTYDATGINIPAANAAVLPCCNAMWAAVKLPWPLWSRDFLYCEMSSHAVVRSGGAVDHVDDVAAAAVGAGDKLYGFTVTGPFTREDCPELEKDLQYVRGVVKLAGYIHTPAPGSTVDKPRSTLTYIVLADAKGSLPGVCPDAVMPC